MPNTAIVLFQLGGPDSIDAVEPFLYNLFRDPDIFDFPGAFLARNMFARRISSSRTKPVTQHYREIGGKSPINELTESQARELERSLRADGMQASVFVAMRYWKPLTEDAIHSIQEGSFDRIVLLPLYPQFSRATTYSSVNEWKRKTAGQKISRISTSLICCYPGHPLYIEALVDNINATLAKFQSVAAADIDLVFSAHGVPIDFVEKGDPYQMHIEETVKQTIARGSWSSPHRLCYQSKVGSSKWLEPSLDATIAALAKNGRRNLLVVPVAFVTEHIETLHEINIEAREEASRLGIQRFEMMPALNSHPTFIRCLAELVKERVGNSVRPFDTCLRLATGNERPSLCPWQGSAALLESERARTDSAL